MTAIGSHFQMHGFRIRFTSTLLLLLRLRTMHCYLTGVAKPAVKRKLEKRERLYDQQKRQRGYLKVWERDHTWLSYDEDKGLMFSAQCAEHTT